MVEQAYTKHKELWKINRNTMLIIMLLTILVSTLLTLIPGIGVLVAGLIIRPVFIISLYRAYQDERAFTVSLFLEKLKESFDINLLKMNWSVTWRLILWGIIPVYGIVKYCEYIRALYIKIENPKLDNKECIKQSSIDMNGNKMSYFIKQLLIGLPLIIMTLIAIVLFVIIIIFAGNNNLRVEFSPFSIFTLSYGLVGVYFGAKLNHFDVVMNDYMEKTLRP